MINRDLCELFIMKILEKTISNDYVWDKGQNPSSFILKEPTFSLRIYKEENGEYILFVTYDKDSPTVELDTSYFKELYECISRLFNYVYNSFPNFNKFLVDYLEFK